MAVCDLNKVMVLSNGMNIINALIIQLLLPYEALCV